MKDVDVPTPDPIPTNEGALTNYGAGTRMESLAGFPLLTVVLGGSHFQQQLGAEPVFCACPYPHNLNPNFQALN